MEEEGLPGLRFQHMTPKANFEAASPFPPRAGEPPKFNIQGTRWLLASGATCPLPARLFQENQRDLQSKTLEVCTTTQGRWEGKGQC